MMSYHFMIASFVFLIVTHNEASSVKCKKTSFSSDSGTIYSPEYPKLYPKDISCTYTINVGKGNRIVLKWSSFDVYGYMPYCNGKNEGSVVVRIGCGLSSYKVSAFCSTNAGMPHTIYSRDNCMSIEFNSNGKSAGGFIAKYSAKSTRTSETTGTCPSDRDIYCKEPGVIMSENWPLQYPVERKDYEWDLKTSTSKVIKLNFMDFDTYKKYSMSSCYYQKTNDYLRIEGKGSKYTSSSSKVYYCGPRNPFSVKTRYYKLEIKFKKYSYSSTGLYRGFAIGFVSYTPKEYTVTSTSIGSIIGGVVVAIAFLICLICGCRWYKRRTANQRHEGVTVLAHQQPKPTVTATITTTGAPPPPYSVAVGEGHQGYPSQQPPGPAPYSQPFGGAPAPYPGTEPPVAAGPYPPAPGPYPSAPGPYPPAPGPYPPPTALYPSNPPNPPYPDSAPHSGSAPYPPQQEPFQVAPGEKQPLNSPNAPSYTPAYGSSLPMGSGGYNQGPPGHPPQ